MVFVETSLFTKLLPGYLKDEDYQELQILLLTIYGKNEKADLGAADLKRVARMLEELTNG